MHEFGHTVMNVGMDDFGRAMVRRCYDDAMARGLYAPGCYMGSCADEYWAEGTQSWFDATVRTDVNGGVNTRTKLRAHDPALALLLAPSTATEGASPTACRRRAPTTGARGTRGHRRRRRPSARSACGAHCGSGRCSAERARPSKRRAGAGASTRRCRRD